MSDPTQAPSKEKAIAIIAAHLVKPSVRMGGPAPGDLRRARELYDDLIAVLDGGKGQSESSQLRCYPGKPSSTAHEPGTRHCEKCSGCRECCVMASSHAHPCDCECHSQPPFDVLALVIKERDEYRALIAKGKGEWPKPGYVTDETWARWNGALSTLECLASRTTATKISEQR